MKSWNLRRPRAHAADAPVQSRAVHELVAIDAGAMQKCVCNRCTELAIAYAGPDANPTRCTALAECGTTPRTP